MYFTHDVRILYSVNIIMSGTVYQLINVYLSSFLISTPQIDEVAQEYSTVTLDDLKRIQTLGMGGFGRVELVMFL